MVKLKELINQAEDNKISWNTKVRLESEVTVKKTLKNVLPENWKKISHVSPNWVTLWGENLINQIERSDKLIGKNDKKFASREILEEFKKYADNNSKLETNRGKVKISEINEDDVIKDNWENIAFVLENSNKIYGSNADRYSFQSEDALRFLQLIIGDNFVSKIEYERGKIFKLEEWKNDNKKGLDIEVEKLNDALELLDKDFPKDIEENNDIEELDLSDRNLEGELDLSGFPNLKKLDCSDNRLTSLELGANSNLVYLDCSYNQLKGKLDLTNNSKLTGLDCSFNEIEELVIGNCSELEMFVCNDNKLRNNLKRNFLGNLNPNKLICLNISDNNLQGNLNEFKRFAELKLLWIGSEDEEKIRKGVYNRFFGSLESLKDMDKLESLHISNTDVDDYSDCLPDNIEVHYSTEERPDSRLGRIKEKLKEKFINSPLQLEKLKNDLEILKKKIEEIQALVEIPTNPTNQVSN